jgi:hypothetical protein
LRGLAHERVPIGRSRAIRAGEEHDAEIHSQAEGSGLKAYGLKAQGHHRAGRYGPPCLTP